MIFKEGDLVERLPGINRGPQPGSRGRVIRVNQGTVRVSFPGWDNGIGYGAWRHTLKLVERADGEEGYKKVIL